MTDYDRIAKVIRYIDAHHREQPDLATLAAVVDLSPSHFHRLFSSWAGVTPKDFLQCLTLEHAQAALRKGESVLDAALDAGLSGPGRLHDLGLSLEAASPGEIKSGGAGWTISAGFAESPFGQCLIAESPRGICHLSFSDEWDRLARDWPHAEILRDDEKAAACAARVFMMADFSRQHRSTGSLPSQPLKLFVRGTAFQVKVWRALLGVPEGQMLSYGRLAAWIGDPGAARAVGTAVGNNPIGYLIPCHRVIRGTGALGGYRWGIDRKRAIQALEGARKAPTGR